MKRKEYKVGDRVKKAALFFLACEANPATRLSIPAAMRAKGYSDANDMDQILIQQVCHESQNNNLVRRQWPRLQCWLCLTRQMRWGRCLRGYHQFQRLFLLPWGGRPVTYRLHIGRREKRVIMSRSRRKMDKSKSPYMPRPTLAPPPWSPKRGEKRRRASAQLCR